MEDILGRELKAGDLVVGMVISRDSDGMRHGVFNGKSVHWMKHNWLTTSILTNMYLVENPITEELKIKQEILNKVQEEKDEKEAEILRRKSTVRIPTKDLVIGQTYADDKGNICIYLGKGTAKWTYEGDVKEGYIYFSSYSNTYTKEEDYFTWLPTITVLKTPRKLVSISDKKITSYDFSNKKEFALREKPWGHDYAYYGRKYAKSIEIKLEG